MRNLVILLLCIAGLVAAASSASRLYGQRETLLNATGSWCGCLAGPQNCTRPCNGCCGGTEAVCFSGMDPTGNHLDEAASVKTQSHCGGH